MIKENNVEYMGFGWMDSVKKYMLERVRYIPTLLELTKSNRVLNNIHIAYMAEMAKGYKAADVESGSGDFVKWTPATYKTSRRIADSLNVPNLLILYYFLAIYNLAASGKIPLQKWNPKEYEKQKELQQTIDSEVSAWGKTGKFFKNVTGRLLLPISIIGGLAGYVYYTENKKKL